MSRVIAVIPARSGSKGIPNKNFRDLGGIPLWWHAMDCAERAGYSTCISSDRAVQPEWRYGERPSDWIVRPAELAQDDTPMIDVVRHALDAMPGEDDDIWLLVQPTQPFRKPEHLRQAVALLRETQADSVVSVVPTLSPDLVCRMQTSGRLVPWDDGRGWYEIPTRRQDAEPAYRRDGTVYAFWRCTVARWGSIYGDYVRPLLIDPADSCDLDTEADWQAVEARWARRG